MAYGAECVGWIMVCTSCGEGLLHAHCVIEKLRFHHRTKLLSVNEALQYCHKRLWPFPGLETECSIIHRVTVLQEESPH